ncbi:hypothetical protein TSAR_008447 [Trichomalopsis sarcophagae]|uniref:Uncharacterized protein n=1 Tax=Trichomalopsis sarcophagae TaxID=543379 RepID=A0A232F8Z1_9HYME|nr:hypothetical protein TSAR_008447 [Trichomalopsis sarcophagae]
MLTEAQPRLLAPLRQFLLFLGLDSLCSNDAPSRARAGAMEERKITE